MASHVIITASKNGSSMDHIPGLSEVGQFRLGFVVDTLQALNKGAFYSPLSSFASGASGK